MKSFFTLVVILVLASCASKPSITEQTTEYFPGMKGCFLLFNMKTRKFDKVINDAACQTRYSASSTFKVPLAVMAFDSGALKDENVTLKWDGKKDVRPELNRNHTAKTWMKDSVVWFSQRLTPKIGKAKLETYLKDFKYGNEELSGGLKEAWLISPGMNNALALNAYEQVDFLERLWTDALHVSKRSMKLARDLTYLEQSPKGYELHGKTGSNFFDKEKKVRLGWFVSHLKKGDDQEYLVVTNFADLEPAIEAGYGGMKAKAIEKQILTDLGLW